MPRPKPRASGRATHLCDCLPMCVHPGRIQVNATTIAQQPPVIYLNPYAPISTYLSKYKVRRRLGLCSVRPSPCAHRLGSAAVAAQHAQLLSF